MATLIELAGNLKSSISNQSMNELLAKFIGKKIDVYCGGASSLRGEVLSVEAGVVHLRDDEGKSCYVAIDKIIVVWEAKDDEHRAGFVSGL